MKEFEGKLCVVTGAARGIGKAVAVKFAEKGAGVAMLDINRELLAVSAGEVAERYGVKTWPVYVDASSTDSINQAMDQVLEAAGTPDVLPTAPASPPPGSCSTWRTGSGTGL